MSDTLTPIRDMASIVAQLAAASMQAAQKAADAATNLAAQLVAYVLPDVLVLVTADATGATLANADIQTTIDGANGRIVYLGPGTYLIDASKPIQLRTGLVFVMHPNAVLLVKANGLQRYAVLQGRSITDFSVSGGQLQGDRLTHDYTIVGTHEHGYGIELIKCARGTVRKTQCVEFTGDGLSISGEHLFMVDVISLRNRRQGLSCYSGHGIRIIRGSYSNTGNLGTNKGTMPMAGIDLEPDGGPLDDVVIDGVNVSYNGTSGVLAWSRGPTAVSSPVSISGKVINCTIVGNANQVETKGLSGPVSIDATRNTLDQAGRSGGAFKVGAGSTCNIGDSDPADANTMTGVAQRTPLASFFLTGTDTRTHWDIQVAAGGAAKVGVNSYTSPRAA
jgi:hypothetical protein